MKIEYKETKDFTEKEVEQLFLSVNWLSGRYPDRLIKALKGSSLVITAWDGSKLVGLLRGIDDGEMVAFLHYLLVHPDYQGMGIATHLLDMAKEKMPDEKENIPFYERHGFNLLVDGAAMQIRHL